MIRLEDDIMEKIDMKQTFAQTFHKLRVKNKYTQNQIAEILHVSDKTISKWETGKSVPDIEILFDIANLFKVSIDYLVTGKTNSQTNDAMKVVYGENNEILHYLGVDGDRLFTRDEVTRILNRRLDRFKENLLKEYGLTQKAELDTIVARYYLLENMTRYPIEAEVKKDKEDREIKKLIEFFKKKRFNAGHAICIVQEMWNRKDISNYQYVKLMDFYLKLTPEEMKEITKECEEISANEMNKNQDLSSEEKPE